MNNKKMKFLTLGAALASSAILVSCDGDDGKDGVDGVNVGGGNGGAGLGGIENMKRSFFSVSDLKLSIETDSAVGEPLRNYELSYDIDSPVSADLDAEDDDNNTVLVDAPVDIVNLQYVDGSAVATIDELDQRFSFDGPGDNIFFDLTDVVLTYTDTVGNTLVGTFTAGAINDTDAALFVNDSAAASPVATDFTDDISGVGTVANNAAINTDENEAVVSLATLEGEGVGDDLSLVIYQGQLYISEGNINGDGDVDTSDINTADEDDIFIVDRDTLSSGAQSTPSVLVSGTWYQVEVVIGATVNRLTGTFRHDLDATLFTAEPDITDTTGDDEDNGFIFATNG